MNIFSFHYYNAFAICTIVIVPMDFFSFFLTFKCNGHETLRPNEPAFVSAMKEFRFKNWSYGRLIIKRKSMQIIIKKKFARVTSLIHRFVTKEHVRKCDKGDIVENIFVHIFASRESGQCFIVLTFGTFCYFSCR